MRIDRRPLRWSDVPRGVTQLSVIGVVAIAIFFLDEARLALESGATLMLVAQEAGELRPGGAVWVAGKHAGKVTDIRFVEGWRTGAPNLRIRAVLTREAAAALRRDASAKIEPSGLLAPFVVNLEPGSSGAAPYDFRDTLRAEVSIALGSIASFGDSLSNVLAELRPVVVRLRDQMKQGDGTLQAFSHGRGFARLQAALADLRTTMEKPRSIDRLMSDTMLSASVRRSTARLNRLADRVSADPPGRGVGGSLGSLIDNLQALEDGLVAARGSAGRALYDREIQNQANLFRSRLDTVRAELAREPFAWLRFRLF